jgi:HEAT repeat protein
MAIPPIPPIPPIHVEIPPIPPIEIPHFDCEDFVIDFDGSHSKLFKDLSDDEQLKIHALRTLRNQEADRAIPTLAQIIKKESHPALRYEAVRQLGDFIDDERVITMLGKIAKTDSNLEVKKKAIRTLGRSDSQLAIKILEEIAEL